MNTIEPIRFSWEGNGIDTDENFQPRLSPRQWQETSDFIFHQAVTELCEEISPYTLQEKYSEMVESEIEPIKDVLPLPESHIRVGNIASRDRRSRFYYVSGETVVLPDPNEEGVARLVSNNKNSARDIRDKLKSKLQEKAEQFHGAGVEDTSIEIGEEYTIENITHPIATLDIDTTSPGDFEQQVIDKLKPMSESFVSNVEVDFEGYSYNLEYDILISTNSGQLVNIEVKDYSGTDNEPGAEEVIHRPLRRSGLLDVIGTFAVIRGVEDETMKDLKAKSELRQRIDIVTKDEIKESIKPVLQRAISSGRVVRTRV